MSSVLKENITFITGQDSILSDFENICILVGGHAKLMAASNLIKSEKVKYVSINLILKTCDESFIPGNLSTSKTEYYKLNQLL